MASCAARSGGVELSGLITVVSTHREQAILHVGLLASCAVLERQLPLRLPDSGAEAADIARFQPSPSSAAGTTWTATLSLN